MTNSIPNNMDKITSINHQQTKKKTRIEGQFVAGRKTRSLNKLHVWHIYLQNWAIFMVNVGQYSSTMDRIWVYIGASQTVTHDFGHHISHDAHQLH